MIEFLARHFTGSRDLSDPRVRQACGYICSLVSIVLNILLSAAKFVVGTLAGSVSITADAVNNLSDAGSSVLVLLGFRISGMKPDRSHPFGHGRFEYVVGLMVAGVILFAGLETLRHAVDGLFDPAPLEFRWAVVLVLVLSILVKVVMGLMNRRVGKKIRSEAVILAGNDALTDTVSTALTLVCLLLYRFTGVNLDAPAGLFVAGVIIKAGCDGGKETLSRLLGRKADPEIVESIREILGQYPEIRGIHDLMVHDYGPGQLFASVHAEVDGNEDIYRLHDAIDRAENALSSRLNCQAIIHMDPVDYQNENLFSMKEEVRLAAEALDPRLSIHDFRMVPGPTHTNLIFDVLAPYDLSADDESLRLALCRSVQEKHPDCRCVIRIDKSFV